MFDRVLNMSLELSVPNISNGRNLDKAEKLKTFPFLGCLRMREAGGGGGGGGPKTVHLSLNHSKKKKTSQV